MGILENFESYMENLKDKDYELCYYCEQKSKYTDVAKIKTDNYGIINVCEFHSYKGLSS